MKRLDFLFLAFFDKFGATGPAMSCYALPMVRICWNSGPPCRTMVVEKSSPEITLHRIVLRCI